MSLAVVLRSSNETIDRRTMKSQTDQIYADAKEDGGVVVEIFSKLVQKLPNQQRISPIGEMELIVNYLNPILSAFCHCPDKSKLLFWLNRQDEYTSVLQPDATMVTTPQKTSAITMRYVEAKPNDALSNPELAFVDLVRLGTFGLNLVLKKSTKKAVVIQHYNGITIMADILNISIPKYITEIAALLHKVDDIIRLASLYTCQIECRYKRAALEDDMTSMMENVKPNRRKQRLGSFSWYRVSSLM